MFLNEPTMERKEELNCGAPELALIDDDELIRAAWSMVAGTRGEKLRCFESYEEFISAHVETATPIYVDFQLGGGRDGIDVAVDLISRGYRTVFISTGMPLRRPLPEGIQGVVGKEYPSRPLSYHT